MNITILTLFPKMFQGPFDHSIIKKAQEKGLVNISFVNIRDFGIGKHRVVDDTPYGGGIGMVMRVDVVHKAIEHAKKTTAKGKSKVILLSADGIRFDQKVANSYAKLDSLILICGHYEGVDERVKTFVDEVISVGDFIATGGEIPAMLVTDAVVRLNKDVLKEGATESESFSVKTASSNLLLEYPQYTRPDVYESLQVPEILLSGDHAKIATWREEQALEKTKSIRPDLLDS